MIRAAMSNGQSVAVLADLAIALAKRRYRNSVEVS
jgi:hypothetical protein